MDMVLAHKQTKLWTRTFLKFGFSGPILAAILALYSTPCAQVYTSNILSRPFPITNRTQQGCPLSPSILNLLMEPLAETIRTHPDIHGFTFLNKSHIISLFSDDVILCLMNPATSLANGHNITFSNISYGKVKFIKALILHLNLPPLLKTDLQSSFPYSWTNRSIPYLQLLLTADPANLADANYLPLMDKLSKKTKRLTKVELSWSGRIAIFKMLCLPQILYIICT